MRGHLLIYECYTVVYIGGESKPPESRKKGHGEKHKYIFI